MCCNLSSRDANCKKIVHGHPQGGKRHSHNGSGIYRQSVFLKKRLPFSKFRIVIRMNVSKHRGRVCLHIRSFFVSHVSKFGLIGFRKTTVHLARELVHEAFGFHGTMYHELDEARMLDRKFRRPDPGTYHEGVFVSQ